jgi:membrane-associated protein
MVLLFPHFISIFDIELLIRYGGLLIVFLIVYASTGLFFCFFLPSGGVLFTAGVLVATGALPYDLVTVCLLLTLASILGNSSGYWFGRKAGPSLYRRPDSRFFKRQYLVAAEEFYRKYRKPALIIAFFLPILRAFAPIVAGMIRMSFRRFILPTLLGSVLWIISFVGVGYFIASRPLLKPYLKYIVIGVILLVTIPVVIKIVRELKKTRKNKIPPTPLH